MNNTNKLFLLLILLVALFTISAHTVEGGELPVYPVYGYNTEDNICNYKQMSEDSPVNESLRGYYSSLRDCRSDNPQIIFHTGAGIIIWFGIFLMVFLFHYNIFPKLEKRTKAEKVLFALQDITILGIILFFNILLQHYFDVPRAVYNYQSDIDHILYKTIIYYDIPALYAITYVLVNLTRAVFIYKKNKK